MDISQDDYSEVILCKEKAKMRFTSLPSAPYAGASYTLLPNTYTTRGDLFKNVFKTQEPRKLLAKREEYKLCTLQIEFSNTCK